MDQSQDQDKQMDVALIKIIKLIPISQWASLESVSRQFRRAIFAAWLTVKEIKLDEHFVYNRLHFLNSRLWVLKKVLKKLALRAPNVISIEGFPIFTQYTDCLSICGNILDPLTEFYALERVSFAGCHIYEETLADFLKTSANRGILKELDFTFQMVLGLDRLPPTGKWDAENDLDQEIRPAFDKLVSVRSLTLECCSLNKRQWQMLIDSVVVEKLTTLHFYAKDENIKNYIFLINRCTELVDLGCHFDPKSRNVEENRQLSFDLLQSIATMPSENLSILKLRPIWNFSKSEEMRGAIKKFIGELGRRFRLTKLNLSDSYHSSVEIIVAIADNLFHLKSLTLPFHVATHAGAPNNLAALLLINLTTKLTRLEKLALQGHYQSNAINGDVISAVVKNLTKLKSLRFDYPKGDENSLACLSELKELKKLHIRNGILSTTTMKAWIENGLRFEVLKFYSCTGLDVVEFIDLIKNQPSLRRLDIPRTPLTDDILKAIASYCPLLIELNLINCQNISLDGVQAVVDGCKMLKRLEIGNNRITSGLTINKYRKIKFD